mgnify:CR=1 FL=1
MITDIGEWFRTTSIAENDDRLAQRRQAAVALTEHILNKATGAQLVGFACYALSFLVADPPARKEQADVVADAISVQQPSFDRLAASAALELKLTLLVAIAEVMRQYLDTKSPTLRQGRPAEVLAQSLVCAMRYKAATAGSFLEGRLEALLALAEQLLTKIDHSRRSRKASPQILEKAANGATHTVETLQRSVAKVVSDLSKSQALDAEELQALWWTFAGFSVTAHCPYSDLSPSDAGIRAAAELSAIVSGPGTLGIAQLAARTASLASQGDQLTFDDVRNASAWGELVNYVDVDVDKLGTVFPLMAMAEHEKREVPPDAIVKTELSQKELSIQLFAELQLLKFLES